MFKLCCWFINWSAFSITHQSRKNWTACNFKTDWTKIYFRRSSRNIWIHARRQEAETRLNAAENNLKRADELKKQQQKQLDNLKKQAEEATRYKEISREIKRAEAGLYYLKIREIEKDKKIVEKLSELEDEISAVNIDYNHNHTLLEEENKKLAPLRDKKIESAASLQKLNLDIAGLDEEEARVKSLQEKLEKSVRTIESDLEREKVFH